MKSFRDRNPYAVGLVSVAFIALFTGFAFAVGLFHLLEDTYAMEGVFTDAAGLRSGDEVKIAGVKVGRVTGVKADHENGNVRVTWVVNHGVEVGREATAEIALETLLGAKYVRLAGPVEDPLMEDLTRDERVIPVSRTQTPFDVFELTRIATNNIEQLHTEQLNAFINDLADVTEGKRDSVTALIEGLDRVSAAIVERDDELRDLLEQAEALSGTLAEKDQTLVQLVDASEQILTLIANRRDELAAALGEGADAVVQLGRLIGEHRTELDRILDNLHPTLDVVAAHQDDLDVGLAWAGPAFYQQALAGSHGPWLDIFVYSLGVDPQSLLCGLFNQLGVSSECPP